MIPEGVLKALDSWSECQFDCESEIESELDGKKQRQTSLPDLSFVYDLSSLRTPRKSMRQLVEKDIAPPHTTWFRPGRVRVPHDANLQTLSLSIESHLKDLQAAQELLDESISLLKDFPSTVTAAATAAATATASTGMEEGGPEVPPRRRSAPVLSNSSSSKGSPSRTNSVPTRIYVPFQLPTGTAGSLPRRATVSGPTTTTSPSTTSSRRNSRRSQTAAARASLPDLRASRQTLLFADELDSVSELSSVSPKSNTHSSKHTPNRQTTARTKSNCSKRSLYDLPNHLDVSQTCCSSSSISQ